MPWRQVEPHRFRKNEQEILPIATFKLFDYRTESFEFAHIYEDIGCYVLCRNDGTEIYSNITHWFPEAVKVLATLPVNQSLNDLAAGVAAYRDPTRNKQALIEAMNVMPLGEQINIIEYEVRQLGKRLLEGNPNQKSVNAIADILSSLQIINTEALASFLPEEVKRRLVGAIAKADFPGSTIHDKHIALEEAGLAGDFVWGQNTSEPTEEIAIAVPIQTADNPYHAARRSVHFHKELARLNEEGIVFGCHRETEGEQFILKITVGQGKITKAQLEELLLPRSEN